MHLWINLSWYCTSVHTVYYIYYICTSRFPINVPVARLNVQFSLLITVNEMLLVFLRVHGCIFPCTGKMFSSTSSNFPSTGALFQVKGTFLWVHKYFPSTEQLFQCMSIFPSKWAFFRVVELFFEYMIICSWSRWFFRVKRHFSEYISCFPCTGLFSDYRIILPST